MSQVSYGTITIVDTNDIESITIEYAQNQDSSNPPSSGWDTARPTWRQNYFIWQRTRIHKSGTTADKDSFGAAVCLTGSTGATGSTGQSLSTTKTQYTHVASNVTITTSNHTSYTWTDNVPEYDSTKPVYWGRITNTYINPAKTEYIIYKDNGLTEAIANSVEANTNASDALDKANESNSIAIHANENAQGALSISRATQQHFWFNSTTSGSIEAGAYITDTPIDTFKSGKNGGYLLARSDGLELGRGTNKFMTLSATALNFYRPGTNTIDAALTSKGLLLSKGGIEAGTKNTTNYIYIYSDDDATNHKLTINNHEASDWRIVAGKNFGVDKAGNLYASGANIQGQVTITSGSNVYTKDEVDDAVVDATAELISAKEASGSIVHIEDASEYPALDCKVALEPIQDLNGYDKPWVGGAGKNKLPYPYGDGASKTTNGITYTVDANGVVTANGTATADNVFYLISSGASALANKGIASGTYTLNGSPSASASSNYYIQLQYNGTFVSAYASGKTFTYNASGGGNDMLRIYVKSGAVLNNVKFYPMIRLSSVSDATYEPYSNICPISGRTSVDTIVSPTTSATEGRTYTTALGRTVYGGTLDVVSGVLTVDRAMVDLGSLSWARITTATTGKYRFSTTSLNTIIKKPSSYMVTGELLCSIFAEVRGDAPYSNVEGVGIHTNGNVLVYSEAFANYTVEEFVTAVTGQTLVYPLATPQTYQLTPQQIELFQGVNNVWADFGDTYLKYVTMNSDMLSLMDKSNADLSRAKAEIKVTTDGISSEVSKKTDKDSIISTIRQSAETVKIKASQVEIDGTATFNAISDDVTAAANTAIGNATVSSLSDGSAYSKTVEYSYTNNGQGSGYAKICNIAPVSGATYFNQPIRFDISTRSAKKVTSANIVYSNNNTATAATIALATYSGDVELYYLSKGSGSYDIYFKLGESYDEVKITNFYNPQPTKVTVTWAGAYHGKDVPSEAVKFKELSGGVDYSTITSSIGNKADKTAAVAEEQLIYISKASGTTSVSGTTTWITETGNKQNTWSTKRPTYNSSYPVLFVAKQKKVVNGTVTCTTPVKDDTTTIIDGGHITTGTIDSNRLNADTIKVNAANIQGSLTIGQLPSTVAETSDIPTKVSELTNDSGYQNSTQVSSAIDEVRSYYIADIDSKNGITIKAVNGTTSGSNTNTQNYIKLNAKGLDIYKGGDSVAFYGNTTRIGKPSGASRMELDYHSLQLLSKEDKVYFYVSDLRDSTGTWTLTETFTGDGTYTWFEVGYEISTLISATDSSHSSNPAQFNTKTVSFTTAPSNGATVTIKYTTTSAEAKAFSFLPRKSGSRVGGGSFTAGRLPTASGRYSVAINELTTANGTYSFASGSSTTANGYASHAAGGSTQANGTYSHSDGYGTIAQYRSQFVIGDFNALDTGGYGAAKKGTNIFIIGKGTSTNNRSNAMAVTWTGKVTIASTLTQNSDRRLKDHINYLNIDAIEFIKKLKPVHYLKDKEHHLGFYAQDIESIDPWNCMVGEMNGFKTLGYTEIIAPLVAYCQHLEERIKQLEES